MSRGKNFPVWVNIITESDFLNSQPCKGLLDLNRANDWHLALCLALHNVLVAKGIVTEKEMQNFLQEAAKVVVVQKMKLASASQDDSAKSYH
ncbi:MAG: hypothetical protein JSW39_22265 [Desulfobacterales bacterium]|nr:MAG: hypothetical protein JSW39_22265 [Desulfobacterales bacterium]